MSIATLADVRRISDGPYENFMPHRRIASLCAARPPPWTTLYRPQPARSPLINRGKQFRQTAPLLAHYARRNLVGPEGFEPSTNGLRVRCSTN
jgi:hypothetical protein